MKTKPNVMILRTEGTNCDEELFFAFKLAGGNPHYVHINELRNKEKNLQDYQVLALPGGFAYGDDVASGKILAVELTSFFKEELTKFVKKPHTATIGVCNGFQVLIRTGLLPFGLTQDTPFEMRATLTNNDSGHFECRWGNILIEKNSTSQFTKNIAGSIVSWQIAAHGEGKFFTDDKTLQELEKKKLVVFRYVDSTGKSTQEYPENPNGSLHAIAGITDPTGRIVGLMPHPERFVLSEQHPNWRRENRKTPHGLPLFQNIISFVKNA